MMFGALLLTVVLGTASAQTVGSIVDRAECDSGSARSSKQFYPLANSCTKFVQCTADVGKGVILQCTNGLYFDPAIQACNWPYAVNCQELDCSVDGRAIIDDSCCGGYFKCENGEPVPTICPNYYPFDSQSGQCFTFGQDCTGQPRCGYRRDYVPVTEAPKTCDELQFRAHENSTCLYYRNVGGKMVLQECAKGTEFVEGPDGCGCLRRVASGPCAGESAPNSTNSCTSPASQFSISVSNGLITGSMNKKTYWVAGRGGVAVGTDSIQFNGQGQSLRIPMLAGNSRLFSQDFGVQTTFSPSSSLPLNTDIYLMSNDFGTSPQMGRNCPASVTLKVRLTDSFGQRQMTVTFEVRDASNNVRSISATFNVDQTRNWYRVTVGAINSASGGTLRGRVERASNPNMAGAIAETMQSASFAAPIQTVACNPGVGCSNSGTCFAGTMRDFTIYYQCTDIANMLN